MSASDPCLFYVTWPDIESAKAAARALVEARLAACAVLSPNAVSIYRWQDEIEESAETLMLVKTTNAAADAAEALILRAHPYDVPAIFRFSAPADAATPAYLNWLRSTVVDLQAP